jgi:hypothetical protein
MIQEYAFRVKTLDNPLMRFTAENPDHRILITLLRDSVERLEERAIFTFLGDNQTTRRFLTGEFTKRYGSTAPIHEAVDYVSVEVSTHLLPSINGKPPNRITYDILGPDAVFLPLLVMEGWLHVRVLSANETNGARFLQFLSLMKEHLKPDAYHLYPVRAYRPEARLHEATEDITPRQQEVLAAAYEMGYWAEPRRCNLEDIAHRFHVSKAAIHKSLSAGERKVMATFFEDIKRRGGAGTASGAPARGGVRAPQKAKRHR